MEFDTCSADFKIPLLRLCYRMALESEFKFYLEHQEEFVKKYSGKVIVIKEGKVLGVYDSELQAVRETSREHDLGSFLVQKCEPGAEAYSQTFHSRVLAVRA